MSTKEMQSEIDTLRQQLAAENQTIKNLRAQNDRLREALQNWIKYFQADIPTTADTHEAQAEDFTKYWFTTQEALSQT